MIFLTLRMSLKCNTKLGLALILTKNLISNGNKLLNYFQKLGKMYSEKAKKIACVTCIRLVLFDHQLLKDNRSSSIDKMNSKEIYSIIISSKVKIPTSPIYFEKRFPLYNFQWKDIYIYILPHSKSL